MRKIILAVVGFLLLLNVTGQDYKGSFLTVAGGLGGGGFQYVPKGLTSNGVKKDKFGWNAKVAYSYYFTPHWGISAGVGMAYYRTIGKYNETFSRGMFYNLGYQIDDDQRGELTDYQLRVRLANWEEEQKGYFFEIPIMLMYKHKFGETKRHGFYIGAGAKLQIPIIKTQYRALDGDYEDDLRLNVSGYYQYPEGDHVEFAGDVDDPRLSYHGFGYRHNPSDLGWKNDLNLKMSVAGTFELGFLFGLSKRVDLMIGGYFDYGFNNIKNGENKPYMEAPDNYLPGANGNVGQGIYYNGMINSDRTTKVNLMAYGGRVGLQIKLGKLPEEPKDTTPLPMFIPIEDNSDLDSLEKQLDQMRRMLENLFTQTEPEPEPEPELQIDEPMILVQGTVLDAKTREPLSAVVEISLTRNGKLVDITRTDNIKGNYKFPIEEPGNYSLDVRKEGYFYHTEEFMIPFSRDRQVINQLVLLTKIEVNQEIILKNIFFDSGKSTLKPESMSEIERVYKLMVDNPTMEIEISGHTDNVGSEALNKKLSAARAGAVVQVLINKGIPAYRMTSAGYGFDKPIAPNTTPDGRAQNRRTEFKVTKM